MKKDIDNAKGVGLFIPTPFFLNSPTLLTKILKKSEMGLSH